MKTDFVHFDVIKTHTDITGDWLNHMQFLLQEIWWDWSNGCRKNRVNFSIFVAVCVHNHILIKLHINENPQLFICCWHFYIFLMHYMIVSPSHSLAEACLLVSVCLSVHACIQRCMHGHTSMAVHEYKELIHCFVDILHLEKEKTLKHLKSNCWLSKDEQKIWWEQQNELLGTLNHFCYLLEAFCSANISE